MSTVTTTQTQAAQNGGLHGAILRDYELHHSRGGGESLVSHPLSTNSANHPEFDLPHRRVPAYRPLNRDPERIAGVRVYSGVPEQMFITAMFRGLSFNAVGIPLQASRAVC
jgi:hypothetical protein